MLREMLEHMSNDMLLIVVNGGGSNCCICIVMLSSRYIHFVSVILLLLDLVLFSRMLVECFKDARVREIFRKFFFFARANLFICTSSYVFVRVFCCMQ